MKIMTLTDLHLGAKGSDQGTPWEGFFETMVQRAFGRAMQETFDVFLFLGDAAEPGPENDRSLYLRQAIATLSQLPIAHKLWVAGNNDIECLDGPLSGYIEELGNLLGDHFYLLDEGPVYLGEDSDKHSTTAFVGNLGWYNGSLWRGTEEERRVTAARAAESYNPFWKKRGDITGEQMFRMVQEGMAGHVQEALNRADQVIVASHFIPSSEFALYGDNPEYDYLNWFMGYDGNQPGHQHWAHPKVTFGLTGHTHRDGQTEITGCPVFNVSGPKQPRVFQLPE